MMLMTLTIPEQPVCKAIFMMIKAFLRLRFKQRDHCIRDVTLTHGLKTDRSLRIEGFSIAGITVYGHSHKCTSITNYIWNNKEKENGGKTYNLRVLNHSFRASYPTFFWTHHLS